jgi:hypothetical protein
MDVAKTKILGRATYKDNVSTMCNVLCLGPFWKANYLFEVFSLHHFKFACKKKNTLQDDDDEKIMK